MTRAVSRYTENGKLHCVFGPSGFTETLRPCFPSILTRSERGALHALWRAGYHTVEAIAHADDADLLGVYLFGWTALRFVRQHIPAAGTTTPECCPTCGQALKPRTASVDKY